MTVKLPVQRPAITTTIDKTISETVHLIDSYLAEFMTVFIKTGLNSRNEPQFTQIDDVPCYYDRTPVKVQDMDGNMMIASGKIYLNLEPEIVLPNDYIVYNNIKYNPVKVQIMQHFISSHQELYIK